MTPPDPPPANACPAARWHSQHGFSLLEALVAFSIMALVLGVLYRTMTNTLASLETSELRSQAAILASSLLELHEFIPPGGIDTRGAYNNGRHTLAWQLQARRRADSGASPGRWPLYDVTVSVTWRASGRDHAFTLDGVHAERPPAPPEQP